MVNIVFFLDKITLTLRSDCAENTQVMLLANEEQILIVSSS